MNRIYNFSNILCDDIDFFLDFQVFKVSVLNVGIIIGGSFQNDTPLLLITQASK